MAIRGIDRPPRPTFEFSISSLVRTSNFPTAKKTPTESPSDEPIISTMGIKPEEMMQTSPKTDEPVQEIEPAETTVPYGTSIHSVPEDVYPIAEEDILATTSRDVFNPQGDIPALEIADAEHRVPEAVPEEGPVVTKPEAPELGSTVPEAESAVPAVPLPPPKVAVTDIAPPDVPHSDPPVSPSPSTESEPQDPVISAPTVPEQVSALPPTDKAPNSVVGHAEIREPEPVAVPETGPSIAAVDNVNDVDDASEGASESESSSEPELELDVSKVGRIPKNNPPPPRDKGWDEWLFSNTMKVIDFAAKMAGYKTSFQLNYDTLMDAQYAAKSNLIQADQVPQAGLVEDAPPPPELRPEEPAQMNTAADAVPIDGEQVPEISAHENAQVDIPETMSPIEENKPISLHDAVVASTKPAEIDKGTFPVPPTKEPKVMGPLPLDFAQGNIGLTYVHPALDTAISGLDDFVQTQVLQDHDGSSMILDPSAYPGGIIDTADPIPRTSNKVIPPIPMVGPVEPTGEGSAAVIVGGKTSGPFVPVAVAPTDGMAKFVKPAGIAVAVGGGIAGLLSVIWLGNKIFGRKRDHGKRRKHGRDWAVDEG